MTISSNFKRLVDYLNQSISIAPLITFRMAFGLVMLFSCIRYMYMGWVDTQLVEPILHFSYFGFDWVEPLPRIGMYVIFVLMCLACIAITLGWFYHVATVVFFLCFTYVELIDITYYLNHYYFVSIVALMLIFVPANRFFSLDAIRNLRIISSRVPRWTIGVFMLQIAIVYCYAGLAKINDDWLLNAMPLSIWLPAKSSLPVIGVIFEYKITAYLFSWLGMFFDTFIILFLIIKKTRWLAYTAVVVFHSLTGVLFQIGIFPLVMILAVTIFFSPAFHERIIQKLSDVLGLSFSFALSKKIEVSQAPGFLKKQLITPVIILFFALQLLFPWRYLLYPGNVFWTEEGYRFAWRVMLMEKAGTATFYVKDSKTGREGSVRNSEFLNPHQEKQMAMQPDLILQFAQYLKSHYAELGVSAPEVRAEVFVTLNAQPAQLLIDPSVDLAQLKDSWQTKDWILPYDNPVDQ